jgi:hypothetical protein
MKGILTGFCLCLLLYFSTTIVIPVQVFSSVQQVSDESTIHIRGRFDGIDDVLLANDSICLLKEPTPSTKTIHMDSS